MSLQGDTKNLNTGLYHRLFDHRTRRRFSGGRDLIISIPNSYSHSTGMQLELYNYIYYGFVTMTTLGYGDIIPITNKSQALALMLVISGQLFLSVIIAINIAKFMQKKVN